MKKIYKHIVSSRCKGQNLVCFSVSATVDQIVRVAQVLNGSNMQGERAEDEDSGSNLPSTTQTGTNSHRLEFAHTTAAFVHATAIEGICGHAAKAGLLLELDGQVGG